MTSATDCRSLGGHLPTAQRMVLRSRTSSSSIVSIGVNADSFILSYVFIRVNVKSMNTIRSLDLHFPAEVE